MKSVLIRLVKTSPFANRFSVCDFSVQDRVSKEVRREIARWLMPVQHHVYHQCCERRVAK